MRVSSLGRISNLEFYLNSKWKYRNQNNTKFNRVARSTQSNTKKLSAEQERSFSHTLHQYDACKLFCFFFFLYQNKTRFYIRMFINFNINTIYFVNNWCFNFFIYRIKKCRHIITKENREWSRTCGNMFSWVFSFSAMPSLITTDISRRFVSMGTLKQQEQHKVV